MERRLGAGEEDANEIKRHPFFATVDWAKLEKMVIEPPFKPLINGPGDTRNIDKMFTNETVRETPPVSQITGTQAAKGHFDQFTYKKDNLQGN
jgi:hypothetical protein